MPRSFHILAIAAMFFTTAAIAKPQILPSRHYDLQITTIAEGLKSPWSMAWLPDGRMLVTEKPGRLRIIANGRPGPPVKGLPQIENIGQGGLLDIAVDPDFASNGLVYFSYVEPGRGGVGTSVARARLAGNQLFDVKVIFRQTPKSRGGRHFGSRIVIARDGTLFITTGDRGEHQKVQNPAINRGQIIRINKDGSIPADNPFLDKSGFRPEIWSYGHRNPQGAALHPATGKLWIHEHGAKGGDEINIPLAGKNYGWPLIAYGTHYTGEKIGLGTHKEGMEQPVYYWDPSIAPSGMTFYTGDKFPEWKGNLFIGALKYRMVSRLVLKGEKIVSEERILGGLKTRIRDVRQGPDGYLYVLTNARNSKILRIAPAGAK